MDGASASASVASAAAQQSSASSSQLAYLQDALAFCQNRRERCINGCLSSQGKASGSYDSQGHSIPLGATNSLANIVECSQIVNRGRLPASVQCLGSPLVLRLSNSPIELTSPWRGVSFDLLGRLAAPAHSPVPISWFTSKSADDTYFLALPDEHDQVGGVDQLFGNNTYGPDQKFAANGFEALAKYDGRRDDGSMVAEWRDGVLDKKDPIFARLRLWHDLNRNGIAESSELLSLTEAGIVSLDLKATSFEEVDPYGNSLKMRSTAALNDGSYRLVFDLWFALP